MRGDDTPSCRLYLVTPPTIDFATFPAQVEAAFSGGDIGCLQLRLKDASDADILNAARAIEPIVHAHDAAFILNDRPDLMDACKADGVHIGQEDLETWPIEKIRAAIGADAVLGITCHASVHLAMEAGEAGADYIAFGAFYPTSSKPREKLEKWGTPDLDILTWWQTYTVLPCVAIGGITPGNCAPLVQAGADFIAAITSVWNHPDGPKAAVEAFNQAIRHAEHSEASPATA